VTPAGEPFGIKKSGPRLVRMLRGGRASLRAELALAYFTRTGSAASQAALTDALQVISGMADRTVPTPLHLRVARHGDDLVLDLGDTTGRVVVMRPDGWQVVADSPVLFRRTELTGQLPPPEPGATLDELWNLLNVAERWPADRGQDSAKAIHRSAGSRCRRAPGRSAPAAATWR
jgi:hypothetical protein